jgi:K+-transporting ATPase ATPase B chain
MEDNRKFFNYALIKQGIIDSFKKLNPVHLVRNPVMFLVEIGAVITTYFFFKNIVTGGGELPFTGLVTLWLWFTVLFANFAEAAAEGRGRAQAETLRRTRVETNAKLVKEDGE